MRPSKTVAAFALWGILVAASPARAQADADLSRQTLKGLLGVQVLVAEMRPDAEQDGLVKTQLQTDVELQLRLAGIRVLTQEEHFKVPGMPYVYVSVGTLKGNDGLYAYSIHVGVAQMVTLANGFRAFAETWEAAGGVGTVGAANLRQVRDSVKDQVNEFINAWLSVNPMK